MLKVVRLAVLGHCQCGAVKAMAYGAPPHARDFIASWVEIGRPALAAAGEEPEGRLGRIEVEIVRLSLVNLLTFPWIAEAAAVWPARAAGISVRRSYRRARARRSGRADARRLSCGARHVWRRAGPVV